ncbi:putative calcium-binding protein [Cladobotryum mycophilum]|uniref:Calcium-binding protein n=1 Tax=Cladobotryum mycophilum TaxID=491253 RepID=A0ABR0SYB7_9HYPO
MSAATGVDPGAPNLNLSPEEKRIYGQLFRQADGEGVGVVTGEVAVKFFEKTRLDSRILGEIWQIADKENRGFLTPAGFGIVLRLIGHAQAGREPTPELALQQGPIPRFEGLWPPQSPSQPPLQPQSSGGAIRIPPLTPDKVAQYSSLFERQNLQGGFLPGEQARSIFDKSGLPNEALGRIWGLADTEARGALALPEFIIAMHLLTSTKTGTLRALPTVLPPGLYEAASRTPTATAPRQSPSNTGITAPLPRQLSGSASQRTGSPLGRPPMVAQAPAAVPGPNDWLITPHEKAKFDQIYEGFDKTGRGFITGEEAVPFLSQSGLPEDSLAQIWDLADFDSHGRLSRDGFAVAMYLIRQQRSSRANPLPATLPQNLIPPHRRNQTQARPATAVSSAFDAPIATSPVVPAPKSALEDLFGLDSSTPSPAMAPAQTTMSTGGSNINDPFGSGSSALRPSSPLAKPSSPTAATSFKPFVPSSSFGRGLAGQPLAEPAAHRSASEDLLSDTDHETNTKISEDATELANLSNQISSLAKQTQDVQSKRAITQVEFNQTNSQKQNFEQRLAQLRQLYEKEAQDTHSLEERLRNSRADSQKLQGECMTLEGQLRDVQAQHQQLVSALQTDQNENSSLRERIRVANGEIAQLKPQIDKLRLEARQQKGLVAINKKQLSTTEGERDKLKSEAESLARSVDDISRQAETGSPVSVSAQLASPTPSTSSANNPFFKRTASTDILGVFGPQPPRTFSDKSFDELFGPAGPSSSNGTPPPASAFKQQHTVVVLITPSIPPTSRHEGSGAGSFPFPGVTSIAEDAGKALATPSSSEDAEKNDSINATPVPAAQGGSPHQPVEGDSHAARGSASFDSTDNAKAKEDFDNAFAAFTSAKSPALLAADASKPLAAFDTEFPPISELERDDSDSASDGGGFDDDFAPASPEAKSKEQKLAAAASTPEPHGAPVDLTETAIISTPPKESAVESKSPEFPSSPATITQNNGPTSQASTADDIFGSGTLTASSQHAASTQPKGAFDDLDDDFEGLEDAKEGSADDDFANISRSGLDDYNPMFDSSPPASQAKSESTAFGNESGFDFISSNSVASGTAGPGSQQKGAESHDWDAIFANLDSPGTATPPAHNDGTGAAQEENAESRPSAPGRALTEGGEHDDPILKSLTGMGYSRPAALAALEAYDYNLEKAANHLASQS